jgi:membrane protein
MSDEAAPVVQSKRDAQPDSPTDLTKASWTYVSRKTVREFLSDECTDVAAALTYYSVLALFPAMIAVLSLVGLVGEGPKTAQTVIDVMKRAGVSSTALTNTITQLASARGAGIALVVGLLTALWSASGYLGAFARAMNRIYGVAEGRPVWKLRPVLLLLTLGLVLLAAVVALALVASGPVATAIGDQIGMGPTAVRLWNIIKWPVILIVVIVIVASLYYFTPNVKQPKFRWLSLGAIVAIVAWIVLTIGFGFYVAHFSSFNKTYGSLAGAVVFLLWLWLTNLALLFGAELDAELERGRQLQAGTRAERDVQLPPRDTRNIEKAEAKTAEDLERGRRLRESHGQDQSLEEDRSDAP